MSRPGQVLVLVLCPDQVSVALSSTRIEQEIYLTIMSLILILVTVGMMTTIIIIMIMLLVLMIIRVMIKMILIIQSVQKVRSLK